MNTKIMEGLVGARTNINIANTPLRVYKEARRKGDTATMERAMGYAKEFEARAERRYFNFCIKGKYKRKQACI